MDNIIEYVTLSISHFDSIPVADNQRLKLSEIWGDYDGDWSEFQKEYWLDIKEIAVILQNEGIEV